MRAPGIATTTCIFFLAALVFCGSAAAQSSSRNKVEEITFDDVKLQLEKDEPFDEEKLTDRVKELDKKPVRIRGWILPASAPGRPCTIASWWKWTKASPPSSRPGRSPWKASFASKNTSFPTANTTRFIISRAAA
jgi:hypothetical protein